MKTSAPSPPRWRSFVRESVPQAGRLVRAVLLLHRYRVPLVDMADNADDLRFGTLSGLAGLY